jgi:hypothetical protein
LAPFLTRSSERGLIAGCFQLIGVCQEVTLKKHEQMRPATHLMAPCNGNRCGAPDVGRVLGMRVPGTTALSER